MNPSTLRARAGRLLLPLALSVPAALALAAPPFVLDRALLRKPRDRSARLSPNGTYIAS